MDFGYSVAAVRAAERSVMAELAEGTLMARAASAIATQAVQLIGFGYGARVLLLVGGGDNGGDALYAGALLAGRGMQVRAVLAVPERAHAGGLAALRQAGGRVVQLDEAGGAGAGGAGAGPDGVDLLVDGVLGIGASGPVRPELLPAIGYAARQPAPVLSVDLPSGLDPDTGSVSGPAIRADLTVCLGALKAGLLVGQGRAHAGRVVLADIGIGGALGDPVLMRYSGADVAALLPRPTPADDKYSRGVVGVASGSAQYPGAALLSVGASRLGGVGAVRYAGVAHQAVNERWPDVLVSDGVGTAGRVQAWAVGPGLGTDEPALDTLRAVLAQDVPVLVDADALTLLAKHNELLENRSAPTVLTPHDREFERIFGAVGDDRVTTVRRAAADSGAIVLLKGDATLIAEPDGRCAVNGTGVAELATAGSGDVLSGLVGSLLAAGVAPFDAAAAGAYLHGAAGARAAQDGPVTAPDVLAALRTTIAGLLVRGVSRR